MSPAQFPPGWVQHFAGLVAAVDCDAKDAEVVRDFHVAIDHHDGRAEAYTAAYVDRVDAALEAEKRIGPVGAKLRIRPEVEVTYMEGRARWPQSLHDCATPEARSGWETASRGAEVPTRVVIVRPTQAQQAGATP